MSADFAHELTTGIDDYQPPTPSPTHDAALARLDGARAQHTMSDEMADMVEAALWRHRDECTGPRHIMGRAECEMRRHALSVLGLSS